ncbi:MAG: DUF87 domain-containing protein [Candidatus Aenigmarchaeota archaeon]|nr:DUF87 domain-containing protein [Candidatus Aenigmarchaeota archaeon]
MIDSQERLVTSELKRLVPVIGKESAARLSRAYLLADEDTRKRIFEMIDTMKASIFSDDEMRGAILMEPPTKDVAMAGDIRMGSVLYGRKRLYPYMLGKGKLLTHMGIFGSSGYGKTNISYSLIEKLAESNVPVLVFDFSKRNYKDLLATHLAARIDIFTVGRKVVPFRFNPLTPPPGITQSQWMKEFSAIFDHAYWLLGGGRHIILKALDAIQEMKKTPRMADLKDWLTNYAGSSLPPREKNWLATATRPLESLCFRELGDVFDCEVGVTPSDFFKEGRVTVLELDALSTNDKTFFIEIMLQWLRDWLLVQNKREELLGVIILEEAHHVLNRDKANKQGAETVVDLIFREVRELGLGIIYIDQHPSLVSYPALGNTSTHIYMNLGLDTKHSSDVLDASNMLGLDYNDERHFIRKLPIGHGFMLCRSSEFTDPFTVEFPKFEIQKGKVTDEDIKRLMAEKLEAIYGDTEEEADEVEAPARKEKFTSARLEWKSDLNDAEEKPPAAIERPARAPAATPDGEEIKPQDLDEHSWKIVKALGEGRGVFTSEIYRLVKISGKAFVVKIKKLMDLGLVATRPGKVQKNRMNYYFLTDAGFRVFSRYFRPAVAESDVRLDEIIEMFSSAGWAYKEKESKFSFSEDGRTIDVPVISSNDRKAISAAVAKTSYFICANERIKNMVIQEASKLTYTTGKRRAVFVATAKRFGETRKFEIIQIQ